MNSILHSALVVKNTGSWYYVCDNLTQQILCCKIKGKFRLKDIRTTNPIAVGDIVDYEIDTTGVGVITNVHDRKNYIIRRASNLSKQAHIIAANIDQAYIVVTIDFPSTSVEFVDRFLVTAEAYKVPVTIIINKCDLYADDEHSVMLDDFKNIYSEAGYRLLCVSATQGEGIEELKAEVEGRITLFTGNSGVGKSTLINAINPQAELRTGEISDYHNKGKHTTTFSEMSKLSNGGYLIDTPGIKGFGLVDFEKDEVCRYFPDLFKFAPQCQFYNCTHTHEPGCAVKQAFEDHLISESRYISYLKILNEDDKYRK